MTASNEEILRKLSSIEAKLDEVAARQRWVEELASEMGPIAKLAVGTATRELADWEARGAFAMLAELRRGVDDVLERYSAEDARALASSMVDILSALRAMTQPEVLEIASGASEAIGGGAAPVGLVGAMRAASRDEDVQRGLGVALEVLRRVGRSRKGGTSAARATPPKRLPASTRAAEKPVAAAPAPALAPAPEAKVVHWEGHDFDAHGFLLDPSTWNRELAQKIAAGLRIALTDDHWKVIDWVRADYAQTGASPNVRRSANGSGVGTEAMYRLFPPAPGKTCAMIAGVPKPVGCV